MYKSHLRWIHITLTWRGITSRQMLSVVWDHVSCRRSADTVLTWRGNASIFDQVWSGLIEVWSRFGQYVELLSCHHHYLYNYGREMAAWWTSWGRKRIFCSHMHYRCRVFFKNVGASYKLRPAPSWRVSSTYATTSRRWRSISTLLRNVKGRILSCFEHGCP
jgi:hypothetical protein